jgi:hypothetical protein
MQIEALEAAREAKRELNSTHAVESICMSTKTAGNILNGPLRSRRSQGCRADRRNLATQHPLKKLRKVRRIVTCI